MRQIIVIILWICIVPHKGDGAKILAIVTVPSFSHQNTFRPLFNELASRGHEVTFITTHPFNNNSSKIKEVSIADIVDIYDKHRQMEYISSKNLSFFGLMDKFQEMFEEGLESVICHPEILKIVERNEQYDLVFFEYLIHSHMAFGHLFNCPYIGIISMDAHGLAHWAMGNPTHPIANPDHNLSFSTNLNFKQRLTSVLSMTFMTVVAKFIFYRAQEKFLQKCFGNVPSLYDLEKDISMLFINANPLFNNVRALGPATINVSGKFHMTETQPLPKDLRELLDNAKEGVIYLSLGSTVKATDLSKTLRRIFLETFSELPYTVLWKFDENLNEVPKNVHISKWYPQQAVLKHPHIKLFITQGGIQSLEEAIYNYIPLIGIPFFGDQFGNVEKIVEHGFGLSFDYYKIEKATLKAGILEVISNTKYKENVKKMANLTLDQPMTGLEQAVWWTEYVIRHKGAQFLKNPVVDIPWYQYFLLDVVGFLIICTFIILLAFYSICKLLVKLIKLGYLCLKSEEKKKIL